MKIAWSPRAFSALFCLAYVGFYGFEKPLFRYYPVNGEIAWGAADAAVHVGPGMAWYGLMSSAALVALVGAFLVKDDWMAARFKSLQWVFPYGAVAVCLYYLRPYFLY